MNILVTGGAGYIGSHTVVALLADGHNVTIVDNLSNSSPASIAAIETITDTQVHFVEQDVRNTLELTALLKSQAIEAVIHFAALKAVGESITQPLHYYDVNVGGLVSLLNAMEHAEVHKLIFSSSATVYGEPDALPITELAPLKTTTNPYGETKQMAERIIQDVCQASPLQAVLLRYFNPIGAHQSALIGELPKGTPNNLVPYLTQAAAGMREPLTIHGDDYDTPDGSGVRDYIHVVDLADAHVAAFTHLQEKQDSPTEVFNIGTGKGTSVLELLHTFEQVTGVPVPHKIGPRRPGDVASVYASADKAHNILGWKAQKTLSQALEDSWRWQQSQK